MAEGRRDKKKIRDIFYGWTLGCNSWGTPMPNNANGMGVGIQAEGTAQ